MNVEHLVLARKVMLGDSESVTFTLESGTPYRHLTMWVHVGDSVGTVDVDAQPKFAGEVDGAPTNFSASGTKKVFQVNVEEVRPPTRGINKYKDDQSLPFVMKSELTVTNNDSDNIEISVYIMAMATPGGA